jgi:hypothetical protein
VYRLIKEVTELEKQARILKASLVKLSKEGELGPFSDWTGSSDMLRDLIKMNDILEGWIENIRKYYYISNPQYGEEGFKRIIDRIMGRR